MASIYKQPIAAPHRVKAGKHSVNQFSSKNNFLQSMSTSAEVNPAMQGSMRLNPALTSFGTELQD